MAIQRRAWSAAPQKKTVDTNKPFDITIKGAKYTKNGLIGFQLQSFRYDDIAPINKINPDVFHVRQGVSNKVWLWVQEDKMQEFLDNYDTVYEFLKNTNHYSEEALNTFLDKIEDFLNGAPNQEEIENSQKIIASNWRELLQTLSDPEVRKRFLAFQTTYRCKVDFGDAVLSRDNITEVLLQDPQASFVTSEYTWRRVFNREVQDGAPHIIITKGANKKASDRIMNTDKFVSDNGGWGAVKQFSQGEEHGSAFSATKRVNVSGVNKSKASYFRIKVYDVRYTTPIDPNNDKFLEIPTLLNNLTGEINDAAKKMLDQEAAKNGTEPVDYNTKYEGLTNSEEIAAYKNFVLAHCKHANINVSTVGSDEDIIANAVYEYAYQKAESLNKLHDKVKTSFANAVCLAIAATFNIKSSRITNAANSIQQLSPTELETISSDIFSIYRELADFTYQIKESISDAHIMSFNELKDFLLSKTKNKNNIKAQFDDMTSRMDALEK
jgi:hypothetical protein